MLYFVNACMHTRLENLAVQLYKKGEFGIASQILRIALRIPQLEKLHEEGPFAIISAYRWDPGMSISKNKQRNEEFMKALQQLGLPMQQVSGYWGRKEKSFIIKNISFNTAKSFAEKYDQEAFIHKDPSGPIVLYNLHSGQANPVQTTSIKPAGEFEQKPPTQVTGLGINYEFDWNKTLSISAGPVTWDDLKVPAVAGK